MKSPLKTLVLVVVLAAGTVFSAAGEAEILFRHLLNGAPYSTGKVVPMQGGDYYFSPRFLKYYLSGISLKQSSGSEFTAENVYLLVDAASDTAYSIGEVGSLEALDSVVFFIGVDKLRNHQDPTIYPEGHPLGLHNPTMHWGWTAGYRFVALEGSAGTEANNVKADVQLHSVGNELYQRVSVPATTRMNNNVLQILIDAEYTELLQEIDASLGVIFHGYGEETIQLTKNIATRVFSPTAVVSVNHESAVPEAIPTAVPNPASDVVRFSNTTEILQIVNPLGQVTINRGPIPNEVTTAALTPGSFVAIVRTTKGSISHVPFVVLR